MQEQKQILFCIPAHDANTIDGTSSLAINIRDHHISLVPCGGFHWIVTGLDRGSAVGCYGCCHGFEVVMMVADELVDEHVNRPSVAVLLEVGIIVPELVKG